MSVRNRFSYGIEWICQRAVKVNSPCDVENGGFLPTSEKFDLYSPSVCCYAYPACVVLVPGSRGEPQQQVFFGCIICTIYHLPAGLSFTRYR